MRPGQRFEPMRVLAAELGMSLPTVREAISQLKGEGLVEVRHGVGCYVVRRPPAARVLRAAVRVATRKDISELRLAVDPAVARTAARRATPAPIRELVFALNERERASRDGNPRAFTDADLALHLGVARASRSGLAIASHRMATVLLGGEMRARARAHAEDLALSRLHRAMVDAIERGLEHRAARAARAIAWIETRPP